MVIAVLWHLIIIKQFSLRKLSLCHCVCRIASYAGLRSGATLLMVVLPPFEIYVQDVDGKMYTIVVPSSEPEVCEM